MPPLCRALSFALCLLLLPAPSALPADAAAGSARLMVLDPGHFHAALLQKEELAGVSPVVFVYAPLGPDLLAHLNRIALYNDRPERPTHWQSRIYAGADYLNRMLVERPGNILVLSGRNAGKIDIIQRALDAGISVLADKPWILQAAELPKLQRVLETGRRRKLVAYDVMTQRYEISEILQRELVRDPAIFGAPLSGTRETPGVTMQSVHHLLKLVSGQPNLRPPWFFDIRQQGEGITDVGTHLIDLVQWMLSPDAPIDYRRDVQVLGAKRWPTLLTAAEFQRVTGEPGIPATLQSLVRNGRLEYFSNNSVDYVFKGVHTAMTVEWKYQAPEGGGDTELAIVRGSLAAVELRQGAEEHYRPEVFVVPGAPERREAIRKALEQKVAELRKTYPGLTVQEHGGAFQVTIPDALRIGHEAHFSLLGRRFLEYVRNPASLPQWEDSFLLAKYYTTTAAAELATRP